MWRFGWVWQVTDSMYEESTYWYLDVEVWLDLSGYTDSMYEDSTYWYLDVEVWLDLSGYRFYA